MNKKISVITVVFNGEKEIEKTILSVINQTYRNFEYIIIDGNSSDRTVEIIKKYQDKITFWTSEPDKGIYDAMNKGIDHASGDFINFMNAGDFFYNNFVLEKISKFLIDKNTSYFGDYFDRQKSTIIKQNQRKDVMLYNINHQSIFYSASELKKQKFNLNYKILADWVCNMFLFARRPFKYINTIVASYEGNGISNNKVDTPFWNDYKTNIILNYGKSNYLKTSIRRLFRKIRTLLNLEK